MNPHTSLGAALSQEVLLFILGMVGVALHSSVGHNFS